ncbi:MAG: hypothetical protein ABGF52_00565 [Candidatus Asgardarchaeum sp.]
MQRFDVFFKRVFSEYSNKVLALLNHLLPVDCGHSVLRELPVEIVKGALRIDKIYETDTGRIMIIDFEEPFTLDSYFEILMHTAAHIHSTGYCKEIIKSKSIRTNYIPLIISINITKRHLNLLIVHNLAAKINDGVYVIEASPFFKIYLIVFSEMNVAEHLLMAANLCETPEECRSLGEKLRRPELWEKAIKQGDEKIKKILHQLVITYGEMLCLLNPDAEYLLHVWRFSNAEAREIAKDILAAILILFSKEVVQISVSEILTEKEVRDIIEALGIEKAINAVGLKRVIDAVGLKKVIDAVGLERVIKEVGVENIIDTLGKILNLSEEEKKMLLRKYKQRKH